MVRVETKQEIAETHKSDNTKKLRSPSHVAPSHKCKGCLKNASGTSAPPCAGVPRRQRPCDAPEERRGSCAHAAAPLAARHEPRRLRHAALRDARRRRRSTAGAGAEATSSAAARAAAAEAGPEAEQADRRPRRAGARSSEKRPRPSPSPTSGSRRCAGAPATAEDAGFGPVRRVPFSSGAAGPAGRGGPLQHGHEFPDEVVTDEL